MAGWPCVEHGCCQHSILVRPFDSDLVVVAMALQEYAATLSKLKVVLFLLQPFHRNLLIELFGALRITLVKQAPALARSHLNSSNIRVSEVGGERSSAAA